MPDHQESARFKDNRELAGLVERAGLRQPCDLDLMVFFGRHPRSLLSSDSLAAFLGYDITQIAESLEYLLAAAVVRRRQQASAHAARLYELLVDGPASREWLPQLLVQASTRPGRLALLQEIQRCSPQPSDEDSSPPETTGYPPRRMVRFQPTTKVIKIS